MILQLRNFFIRESGPGYTDSKIWSWLGTSYRLAFRPVSRDFLCNMFQILVATEIKKLRRRHKERRDIPINAILVAGA